MTAEPAGAERFRFLASFVAGRPVDVIEAAAGQPAYTNGRAVFVSRGGSADHQRREVLVQSALLGSGSLDRRFASRLRGRPSAARRYLALEGHRVLAGLAIRIALAAEICPDGAPDTGNAEESIAVALGRTRIAEPPTWFGTVRPAQLMSSPPTRVSAPTGRDLYVNLDDGEMSDLNDDLDDEADTPETGSRILRLFEVPVGAKATADFLRKILGSSRSSGNDTAGGELTPGAMRRTPAASMSARPLPTPIRFTDGDRPGAAVDVGGALHPEWNAFTHRYRPDWCRVIDFPVTAAVGGTDSGVLRDDVLRRRLSRVGLGPTVLRARADGDDLDIEALIQLSVDLRSGHAAPEHIHTERRNRARHLGVLVLVDVSGSATDGDSEGATVHDHQRRAAATIAATLEELGDRVAVYGFRSQGRRSVHLLAVKTFGQRFGVAARSRLEHLRPSGYTRLGTGIRGAGELLKRDAGTPHRLLLVLSDGYPYDDGYEGRYAEADARRSLDELRADGVACLCLSIGTAAESDTLQRVFGSACHRSGSSLSELSPHMDELFLTALRELSAPRPARVYAPTVNHK
ncbi:VWA domain-containing protein [Mycobacterium sp. 236(2023)]|uniref:nitric oxide reductase activation protein NorD n=1 Tax=Mycobacterium sp. 236(2023) TaxID=3038163 RepID=UPI0024157B0D|nr:VWA domain-containing protein [Mycobacterium sp. 236(2023)]MDG4668520.1 VWA domain-containing protein [Mycobacterium sp. 236(2023)]